MSVVSDLKELIARGKTKEAIGAVLDVIQKTGDAELYNQAVLLSSRFSDLQRQKNMGVVANQEAALQSNQITHSLLHILDQLPQNTAGKLTYEKPSGEQVELSNNQQSIQGNSNIALQNISGGIIHLTVYQNVPEEKKPASYPESSNLTSNTMAIEALAAAAVAALSPYLVKGAESFVGEAGKSLWNLIKGKFSKDDKAKKKLEKLEAAPEDKSIQDRLKYELEDQLNDDPDFVKQLQALIQNLPKETKNNIMNITGNNNIGVQDVSGSQININR